MNMEQYELQVERVKKYERLTKEIREIEEVIMSLKDGRSLEISAISPISAPFETVIHDTEYIRPFMIQLDTIKSNLEHKRNQI